MLTFMQQVDFSVPAAFSAYIPTASEVAKKARSFRCATGLLACLLVLVLSCGRCCLGCASKDRWLLRRGTAALPHERVILSAESMGRPRRNSAVPILLWARCFTAPARVVSSALGYEAFTSPPVHADAEWVSQSTVQPERVHCS